MATVGVRGLMRLRERPDWSTRRMYEALCAPSRFILPRGLGHNFGNWIALRLGLPLADQRGRQALDPESIGRYGQAQPESRPNFRRHHHSIKDSRYQYPGQA